jgi:hypothetical protein
MSKSAYENLAMGAKSPGSVAFKTVIRFHAIAGCLCRPFEATCILESEKSNAVDARNLENDILFFPLCKTASVFLAGSRGDS